MASSSPTRNGDDASSVRILGVGGGIGSGKSTACKLLVSSLGCLAHIDADSVAHTVYRPGSPAIREIAQTFGDDVVQSDGEIDRKKLGAIVFADRSEMKKLERIVWPHTKAEVMKRIDDLLDEQDQQQEVPIIVVEAAMLLDADWQDFMDAVWMVRANEDVALQRLQENRGWSREESLQRIQAQQTRRGIGNLDDEVKGRVVSAVIDNSGTLEDLQQSLAEKLKDPSAWYSSSKL